MAKAIKFNLYINKKPIRDIDDLRSNFNIDDILEVYHEKVLERWLEVRDLDELTKVKAINSKDNKKIAQELCKIFFSNSSDAIINSAVYPFDYRQKQIEKLKQFEQSNFKKEEIIMAYHGGYDKLLNEMIEKPNDYQAIKTNINIIWENYQKLFRVDFERFFNHFSKNCQLALFAMLANEQYRSCDLLTENRKQDIFKLIPEKLKMVTLNTQNKWVKISDNKVIVKGISGTAKVKEIDNENDFVGQSAVGKSFNGINYCSTQNNDFIQVEEVTHFQYFSRNTEGHWDTVENTGKFYLILKMENNNFVTTADKKKEQLSAADINGKFLILDGIEYKSQNNQHQLIYMEV